MEKVVWELDLVGLGAGGPKRTFPHTELKQQRCRVRAYVQGKANSSVWLGVERMKGLSETPVVLGTASL